MQTEELTLRQIKTELRKLESAYTKLYRQYKRMQGEISRDDLSSSLQNDIYNNGLSDEVAKLSNRISVIEGYITTLNGNVKTFNAHKHNTSSGAPDTIMSILDS